MSAENWSQSQVLAQLDSGEHWRSSVITYAFPTNSGGIFSDGEAAGFRAFNTSQQAMAVLALATWDDLIAPRIVQGNVGTSDIEFGYTSTAIGYAHAYYPDIGSAWFNVNEPDLVNPVLGEYGFFTFVHEIGHALGLNHMGDYNGDGSWQPSSYQDSVVLSVMSYFGPREAAPLYSADVMQADWTAANGNVCSAQTPMLNDVMAIQAIYGVSTTTRLDNTVYGFSSTAGGATGAIYDFTRNRYPVLTLFDAGGTDTLNLSGWSSASRVDLHAGAFSSVNDMTNNVAIDYGTTIENAIGGGGNDVLTGNEAGNQLEGGAGNDALYGLGGDDVLIGGAGDDVIDGGTGDDDTVVYDGNFASYTVTASGNNVTISGSTSGTDRISGVERFRFADGTRTLFDLSPNADTTPPQVKSLSPADDSIALEIGTSFVLTFSEAVVRGSGVIAIHQANGSVWRSIASTDTTQVSINGASVTIDPAANLPANASFYITVEDGAFADLVGNAFTGIAGSSAWSFSTSAADTIAPRVIALSPEDNATGAPLRANLVLQFDETVVAGTGNIVLQRAGVTVATIAASDTNRVKIAGNTVTIDPIADLEQASSYGIAIDRAAFRDTAGNPFAGSAGDAWNFTTAAPITGDDYPMSPDTPGVLALTGSLLYAHIDGPGDGDMFRVNLTAGVTYRFDMMGSSALDPYLVLYGPAPGYELIGYDDNGGPLGKDAQLCFTPTIGGVYYLAASDNAESKGSYGISASVPTDDYLASTATTGRLPTTGSTVFGVITAKTDSDLFAVTLTAGTQTTFDLRSGGLANPYLRLFDSTGTTLLAFDDETGDGHNAEITYTAPSSGTYFVSAADHDTGMGAYRLTAVVRHVVPGTAGDDTLAGTAGADTLEGQAGADRLSGDAGDDILEGGAAIDTAVFNGPASRYTRLHRTSDWVVTDGQSGGDGRDLLHDIERLQFSDTGIALDLDGHAGLVAKILGAVFGPASVGNSAYVGIGLALADGGKDPDALMQLALDARLGAGFSNAALVDLLYTNLAGAAPTSQVRDGYVALIDNGSFTPLSLATFAAEHEINLANINLIGLVDSGLAFT